MFHVNGRIIAKRYQSLENEDFMENKELICTIFDR